MPKTSVVMATYNGAAFIGRQLESLRRQTLLPFELVVSDDGSRDGTLEIVEAFAATVPFPVHLRRNPERLGYGENFLTAALLCRGEYVAFCDQDDEWHAEKLARCEVVLDHEKALVCVHVATMIDQSSQYIGFFDQGIARTQTIPPLMLPPWRVFFGFSQVFRRDLLDHIDIRERGLDSHMLDAPLAHDRWVYFLGQSLGTTVTIAQPLVAYRQHGTNAFGGRKKSLWTRACGKLVGSSEILHAHEQIAQHRSRLMAGLAVRTADPELSFRARAAAGYWQMLADRYSQRARIYDLPSLGARVSAWRAAAQAGLYQTDMGGETFGTKNLAKDFALGVLQTPLQWMTPNRKKSRPAT